MKKIILLMVSIVLTLNAWEINTHRAIDKTAIESNGAINLSTFIDSSGIGNQNYKYEIFEGYELTYFDYFDKEKSSDAMADWNQTFDYKNYKDLIEAGTMLEDAVWPGAWFGGNGRFNNHFYDPQNGGKGLTWGYGRRTDAVSWAKMQKSQRLLAFSIQRGGVR